MPKDLKDFLPPTREVPAKRAVSLRFEHEIYDKLADLCTETGLSRTKLLHALITREWGNYYEED